jgi:hypothetical protein
MGIELDGQLRIITRAWICDTQIWHLEFGVKHSYGVEGVQREPINFLQLLDSLQVIYANNSIEMKSKSYKEVFGSCPSVV